MEAPSGTCVVVPTYNEKENISALLERIEGLHLQGLQVFVVDDSSPDGTADVVRSMAATRPWIKILVREGKKGIGSAYQEGFAKALSDTSSEVIVEMDADLQHPPAALSSLLKAVREGADVAVGSRYIPGGGIAGWSRMRRTVSWGANAYSRVMLGLKVKDTTSGFRAYTRGAAEKVAKAKLPAKGFEFQVASLFILKGSAIVEVPFTFETRTAGESKLRLRDMAQFFLGIARIALSR